MRLRELFGASVGLLLCPTAIAQQPYVYEIQSITGAITGCVSGVGVECTNLGSYSHIYVDGYTNPGDGGGGYFFKNGTSCGSGNKGTVIP